MQQTTVEKAVQHYRDGQFDQAEPMFRSMLDDEPDNPQVLFMLALIAQQRGHNDEGVELVQRALASTPDNPNLHHALGNLRLRQGETKSARAAFRKAVELNPNHAEAITSLGYCLLLERRFEDAEAQLRVALRADPDHVPALVSLGTAMLEQQKYEDAIRYLKHAVEQSPDNARAQAQLGRAFMGNGQAAFANQCYDNARPELDRMPELHEWQGQARLKLGDLDGARRAFRRVGELGLERPDSLFGLARIAITRGHHEQASRLLQRALQLAPGRSDMRLAQVRILLEQGRWHELWQELQPLLEQPGLATAANRVAVQAALGQGDVPLARQHLAVLLKKDPEAAEHRLLAVEVARASGDGDELARQLEQVLAMEQPPLGAQLLRARLHLEQGQPRDAEHMIRQAQERDDLSANETRNLALMLADVQFDSKQAQDAVTTLGTVAARLAEPLVLRQEHSPLPLADTDPESAMGEEAAATLGLGQTTAAEQAPVFVLAWPGSGDEALLGALAAHPDIHVVKDPLGQQAERRAQLTRPRGLQPLQQLSEADRALHRRRYRRSLRRSDPASHQAGLVIDAMQLEAEALPTLSLFYPGARVLLIGRDPRDLTVSWLFDGYDDLEGMARHWRRQQDLLDRCRKHLPLSWMRVDYDRLAEDPETVLRDLLEQLQLDWRPVVLERFKAQQPRALKKTGSWRVLEPWLGATLKVLE